MMLMISTIYLKPNPNLMPGSKFVLDVFFGFTVT